MHINTFEKKLRVLVLSGYGINCYDESADCFKKVGAKVEIQHINEMIEKKERLLDYHILVFPGGFSYGDHINSGKILANKLKFKMKDELQRFVESGRAVLGICNGFQVLVQSGLLPGFAAEKNEHDRSFFSQDVSLIANVSSGQDSNVCGRYEDRWVCLTAAPHSHSFWLKGIHAIALPVRHGKGRLVWEANKVKDFDEKIIEHACLFYSTRDKNVTMDYPENPNGSYFSIAALSNRQGNVFGLMPHPEAYRWKMQAPDYHATKVTGRLCFAEKFSHFDDDLRALLSDDDGYGMAFFYNACRAMRQKFF